MLEDPFGNTDPSESTIWYQSRFYRANLHFRDGMPFFRDIAVYSDKFPQPFLKEATRQNDVEQRMPAILDGFHWSKNPRSLDEIGAGGFIVVDGQRAMSYQTTVNRDGKGLDVLMLLGGGRVLLIAFEEKGIKLRGSNMGAFSLSFEWEPSKATLRDVQPKKASFRWQDHGYAVGVRSGRAVLAQNGLTLEASEGEIELHLAQES